MKVKADSTMKAIVKACFPEYTGRKFAIEAQVRPLNVKSYWDGGSRSYYCFYNLTTGAKGEMPAQSMFDKQITGADSVTLPENVICVQHVIFCGKDLGIRIHVNPANMGKFLPEHTIRGGM